MITSLEQLDLDKTYTYSDYLSWRLQEYVELLKGKIFKMAAPSIKHQRVSSRLHTLIGHHLWKKPCEVFHAPICAVDYDECQSTTDRNGRSTRPLCGLRPTPILAGLVIHLEDIFED